MNLQLFKDFLLTRDMIQKIAIILMCVSLVIVSGCQGGAASTDPIKSNETEDQVTDTCTL